MRAKRGGGWVAVYRVVIGRSGRTSELIQRQDGQQYQRSYVVLDISRTPSSSFGILCILKDLLECRMEVGKRAKSGQCK